MGALPCFSQFRSWDLKGYLFHTARNGLILPLRNIGQMRLIGTTKYQRGKRVKILAETESLTKWSGGDILVQLYDGERNAVVLVKREEYEQRSIGRMKLIGMTRYQRGGRVRILAETQSLTGWKEGSDFLVQLYDEERNAVVLVKREEYERWRSG